jgi:N-acetylmuramoyl-L-alanine amidase
MLLAGFGFLMVFIAYALSALLLALGSDMFYNINSTAARTSTDTEEETQNPVIGLTGLKLSEPAVKMQETKLMNPYGLYENKINQLYTGRLESTSGSGHTFWLLGKAMNEEELNSVMEHMGSLKFTDKSPKNKSRRAVVQDSSSKETAGSLVSNISDKEVKMLERIVEAEASGEDMVGKILIANVIFNRISDDAFPDTVKSVIFQQVDGDYQFSPIADERYWSVRISGETKKAVQRALKGEDYSKGALYFVARRRTKTSSAKWFDNHLDWLFKHGGHEFYKNK